MVIGFVFWLGSDKVSIIYDAVPTDWHFTAVQLLDPKEEGSDFLQNITNYFPVDAVQYLMIP